jgi:steroid delta-isomerase-like uncharacterized protein
MSDRVIRSYYDAFNRRDWDGMVALLTDDVIHDVNQGGREVGRTAFRAFLDRMERAYRETARELVVMVAAGGERAAAELVIDGEYLAGEQGFPAAHGQRYSLPVGAFFDLSDGKIARVTTYYNLQEWLRQVGAS